MTKKQAKAYSLIEMVATLVVLLLVTLIAYPSYFKTKTNSSTNEEITTLGNFTSSAVSLARSVNRLSPQPADWFKAVSEQNISSRKLSVLISTVSNYNPSISQGIISVTDIPYNGEIGIALLSSSGKCIYSQVTTDGKNTTWLSSNVANSNCNGYYASRLSLNAS